MRILNTCSFLIIFILFYSSSLAQGICEDNSYIKGGFSLGGTDVCHNETINIENTGNVENAVYHYNYTGQGYGELKATGVPDSAFSFEKLTKSGLYTVVQVGEKDGEKTVACIKDVKVRVADQPVFSYNRCLKSSGSSLNSDLEIYIPKHSINDYNKYQIVVDNLPNIITEEFSSDELPKTIKLTDGRYFSFSIKGLDKKCSVEPKEISLINYANNPPHFPNIDEIRITDDEKIRINFSGMYNHEYDLYRYPADKVYETITTRSPEETVLGLDGTIFDTPPKPLEENYCYSIRKKDTYNDECGAYILESPIVCTTPILDTSIEKKEVKIELTPYSGIFEYHFATTFWTEVFPYIEMFKYTENKKDAVKISYNQESYTEELLDCAKEYTYQTVNNVRSKIEGDLLLNSYIYSNEVSVNFEIEPFDGPEGIFVSTNADENNNIVKFEENNNSIYNPNKWVLFKEIEGRNTPVDTLTYNPRPTEFKFIDLDSVVNSETYRVALIDECGNISNLSEPASSIFLRPGLTDNTIMWNPESPFSDDFLKSYIIIYFDPDTGEEIKEIDGKVYPPKHKVEVEHFVNKATFQVAAKGEIDDKLLSYSNKITIPIKGYLAVPNAFSPNDDEHNSVFKIYGKTNQVEEFLMEIYNVNGYKIIEIDDQYEGWDGKLDNNEEAPPGHYFYRISAKMINGEFFNKNGSFLLLR